MTETDRKPLAVKLAEITAAVHHIDKRGKHEKFGYRYATDGDVKEAVRDLLADRGIVIVPVATACEVRASKEGTPIVTVPVQFLITDGVETITAGVIGEGLDTQDKGASKAHTAAMKNLILNLFLIPTGGEFDESARPPAEGGGGGDRSRRSAPAQGQQQQRARKPASQRKADEGRAAANAPADELRRCCHAIARAGDVVILNEQDEYVRAPQGDAEDRNTKTIADDICRCLSEFVGRGGEVVAGDTPENLSDKRLAITLKKARALVLEEEL